MAKSITIRFDQDEQYLLDHLDLQKNKTQYIKDLIQNEIDRDQDDLSEQIKAYIDQKIQELK